MAEAGVALMEGRRTWEGTPTELKAELDALARGLAGVDLDGYWPPDAPRLSKVLTRCSAELDAAGIGVVLGYRGRERCTRLYRR